MKSFIFISLFFLISYSVSAQKVTVQVIKNADLTDWQILDDQNIMVLSGNESGTKNTVTFSLAANAHYTLKVTVPGTIIPDSTLITLYLNSEPVLLIKSDKEKGEYLFPFFTGIRTIDSKITGGTNTVISDFPWQVYYVSGNFRCGGSIIGGNWVVTAGHCTKNSSGGAIPVSQMFVKVGANNPSNALEGKVYNVSEVIVNEGYNDQTLLNDIALLRLEETINFENATPIKLITTEDVADEAIVPGVMTWVTGWGLTQVDPKVFPTSLQKVQLPVVSNEQASTVWSSIPASDLMAGFLNGNKDACNGDSGGPMVVPVLGEYRLAGIVSWGSSNCNTYGAYTRVSDFETWIRATTGIARDFKPPPPLGDSIICKGAHTGQYSVQPLSGATEYEWNILPSSAGVISENSENASVLWNLSYAGSATIIYRVTINNKVSDWSGLDVNIVLNTKISGQSGDTTVCAGQPVSLDVKAEGYNLKYKWFKNGQIVQSGPSSKFSFILTTTDDSGDYKCEISGSCGILVSNIMTLTVHPLTRISHISPDVDVPFGNDVILEVNAEGHDLIYQWQKDGVVLENTNTPRFSLPDLNANDIGIYRTTVTGTCGIEISDSIYVYVKRTNYSTEPEVFVWPSVTSGEFTVALSNDSFYDVRIFSTSGKKTKEQKRCRYKTTFNISTMDRGVYIVEVFNKDFRKSIKVIKE